MFDARPNYPAACKRAGKRAGEFKQAILPATWNFSARKVLILPTCDKTSWECVEDGTVQQVNRPAYTIYRRRGDGKIDASCSMLAKDLLNIEDLDTEYKSEDLDTEYKSHA